MPDLTDSLSLSSQKERLKIKQEQLMNKIVANPEDTSSLEARSWSGGPWGVGVQGSLLAGTRSRALVYKGTRY